MKTYRVYQVDAFTTEKFKGNPAGVVADADGLTDAQMLEDHDQNQLFISGFLRASSVFSLACLVYFVVEIGFSHLF